MAGGSGQDGSAYERVIRVADGVEAAGNRLWRLRPMLAAGALAGVLATDLALDGPPPVFEARTDLVLPMETAAAGTAASALSVTSPAVLGAAAARLADGEAAHAAAARLQDAVAVHRAGSDRLRIAARGASAEEARRRAAAVAEAFVADWRERREGAESWLLERLDRLGAEVAAAEARAAALRETNGALGRDALAQRTAQLAQLREREAELAAAVRASAESVAAARAARDALLFTRAAEPLDVPELAGLARLVIEGSRGGAVPEDAIARFDAAFADAIAAREAEAQRLQAEREGLAAMIADWEAVLSRETEATEALARLEAEAGRRAMVRDAVAAELAERRAETAASAPRVLADATETERLSEGGGATVSQLAFGGFAGGLVAALIAHLVARRRARLAAWQADVGARTGLPVLGTVAEVPAGSLSGLGGFLRRHAASQFAEDLASVRDALVGQAGDGMPRVVAVASAGPDPARTTCTLALAQLARMQGRRSVFVECDFLDSPARRQFAIPGRRGLLSVLRGEAAYHEVLHIDQQTGLHIVPGEAGAVDPGAAFDPARFGEFAEILRRTYDCVYVDVAGPLDAPALRAVARWCDALLCLLPDGETPQDAVLAALTDLAEAGPRAVGVAYRRSAAAEAGPAAVAPAPQPPVAPGAVRPATAAEACGEEGARADPNVLYMFREIRDAR